MSASKSEVAALAPALSLNGWIGFPSWSGERSALGTAGNTTLSASREPSEGRHAFRDVVERLLIASEDGDLRVTEGSRFIQSASLDDDEAGRPWRVSDQVRSALAAEFARYGIR